MILMLTRAGDADAGRVRSSPAGAGIVLLRPQDILRPGWSLALTPSPALGCAIDGRAFTGGAVRGVITWLSHIPVEDCLGLQVEDRSYAAAELEAFLSAWLRHLGAPKLNPPSFRALNGDPEHPLRWKAHAWASGLRTVDHPGPADRTDPVDAPEAPASAEVGAAHPVPAPSPAQTRRLRVTVVGDHVAGTDDPQVRTLARDFSRRCGLPLLGIDLVRDAEGLVFAGATCRPDPVPVLPQILDYFAAHAT